jgi:hypothetical protein
MISDVANWAHFFYGRDGCIANSSHPENPAIILGRKPRTLSILNDEIGIPKPITDDAS